MAKQPVVVSTIQSVLQNYYAQIINLKRPSIKKGSKLGNHLLVLFINVLFVDRENKEVRELQFAICRRCPKSYHRKCLPREIAFEDTREGIVQRAWDGLLPNCTLMYCLNHTVMEELTTLVRDHVIFPDAAGNKKIMAMQEKELDTLVKKTSEVSDDLSRDQTSVNAEKIVKSFSGMCKMVTW
uniref:Protein ENHANCED DOWNY MILDEW 2 isoform X2 n=1 Tax=Elaeis guineensis var. tenera TaxID=51953 RepID=A0A6J0PH73_ELAGV|nr:protein ENHANCED DOWNY MILDEW 2 isoform X2 [Elaeis guineensis]